jgi:serine/threonine protein kinase
VSNLGPSANQNSNLESLFQVALSHSLLNENDIAEVLQSCRTKTENVTAQTFARMAIQLSKLTQLQAKILLSKDTSSLSIGPYLILEKIGQGGMGSVYKARHKSMDRVVAIKVLRRREGFSPETIKRFQREVLASAKLIHPNIVTAFDAGEQNGIHFLVMEYVSGGDLKSLLEKQGSLSIAKTIDYVQQVARGMQYAHDMQIIHRDIKPANLLLDSNGCIKILDLGLARIVRDQANEDSLSHGLTADGALMGTVDYLSPEQSFDTKTADTRSDIYSLGCTLYTLLTGEVVFPAGSLVQRVLAHREATVPSLRARRNDVPEALDKLFQRMLSKDPSERPQSMLAIAETLKSILAGVDDGDLRSVTSAHGADDTFLETLIQSSDDKVKEPPAQVPSSPSPQALPTYPSPIPLSPSNRQIDNSQSSNRSTNPEFNTILSARPVVAARRKTKRSKRSWPTLGTMIITAASLFAFAGWMIFSPTKQRLTLKFSQSDIREIVGAKIIIDERTVGSVDQELTRNFELDDFDRERTIQVIKPGFESFVKTVTLDSTAEVDVRMQRTKLPNPKLTPTPNANATTAKPSNDKKSTSPPAQDLKELSNATTPTATASQPSTPSVAPADGPREWVVGIDKNEIPDLTTAIQQARPNDTIRIRHRGPLELSPTDLAGKTPLRIIGDQKAGIDYWPIIRQKMYSGDEWTNIKQQDEASAQPLLYADQVDIHFEKIHFSIGGFKREKLSSFMRCKSGKVRFENCTFTASTDEAERFSEGLPLPFIQLNGSSSDQLDLQFSATIIRGARLKSLVQITSDAKVQISGNQWLWAGGQGAFIDLAGNNSKASLILQGSTLYNFSSLINIPAYRLTDNNSQPFLNLSLKDSVLVARERGMSELIAVSQGEKQSLDRTRWQKLVQVAAINSNAAHLDAWLPSTDRATTLMDFRSIFGLEESGLISHSPMLRVLPAGIELQEASARDLEILQTSLPKVTEDTKPPIGILASKLPATLPRIAERLIDITTGAGVPRGLPTIVEVSKRNGPIRSLEEAFSLIQGDDVEVVITDSETYIPRCNFDIDGKPGVLYTESVRHLTIRAAETTKESPPTIVLSDSPENIIGNVPGLIHWGDWTQNLFLFGIRSQTLRFDGLQFKTHITRNMRHSIFLTSALNLRMTNCRILDESQQGQAFYESANGYGITTSMRPEVITEEGQDGPSIAWIENVMLEHEGQPRENATEEFLKLATAFAWMTNKGTAGHIVFRNCWISDNQTLFFNRSMVPWIEIEGCTIRGRFASMHSPPKSIKVRENIFFLNTNPVLTRTRGEVDTFGVSGGRNLVWMDPDPIPSQQRDQGPFRLMPGERLVKRPEVMNYRLRGRTIDAAQAEDGGPVGFRLDKMRLQLGKLPK